MKRILVTGALGQIGSELVLELRKRYGNENIIASDIRENAPSIIKYSGPYEVADCTDRNSMEALVQNHNVDTIYHLAALLSAVAEEKPQIAWDINMQGLTHMLEICRIHKCALFTPSSIGAFGPNTPKDNTPQDTIQRPTSMYGVTKVAGEMLCDYYYRRFGVDTRGLRFPGLISNATLPGGGTTDYAVEIYYEAIKNKKYTSYIDRDTQMDMMYMPDAIEAMIKIMEADANNLIHRNAFNISTMSLTPDQIAAAIQKRIPEFQMSYKVDLVRQAIADSWPNNIDSTAAKEEWGFDPKFDLEALTDDMLQVIEEKYRKGELA